MKIRIGPEETETLRLPFLVLNLIVWSCDKGIPPK